MSAETWQKAVDLAAILNPDLKKLEKKRVWHLIFLVASVPPVAFVIFLAVAFCFPPRPDWWAISLDSFLFLTLMLAAILTAIATYYMYKRFDHDYRRKAKRVLVYKIAKAMKMKYQPTGLFRVGRVYDHYIFPAYNVDRVEDGFIVRLGRRRIELQEIALYRTYGEGIGWPPRLLPANEIGLVIRIEARKTQPFHTVIIPRSFLRGQFHKSYFLGMHHYERTPFGNPAFARRYEVLSEDHTDAHDLINPDFIEKFLTFEKKSGARSLAISFRKKEIVIYARKARNFFEPGHLLSPVNVTSIRKIYKELEALEDLIQTLSPNEYVGI